MVNTDSLNFIYEEILIRSGKENDIQKMIDSADIGKENKTLLLALWYAWHGLIIKADQLLKTIPGNQSVLLKEIELLLSIQKRPKLREMDEFINSAKNILNENEFSLVANRIMGRIYYALRQYPKSIEFYEKIIARYPKGDGIYLNYCEALYSIRKFERAKEALAKAPEGWRKVIYEIIFPLDDSGKKRTGGFQWLEIISGFLFCIPIFRAGIYGALINFIPLILLMLMIFILLRYFGERIITQLLFIIVIMGGLVTIILGSVSLLFSIIKIIL